MPCEQQQSSRSGARSRTPPPYALPLLLLAREGCPVLGERGGKSFGEKHRDLEAAKTEQHGRRDIALVLFLLRLPFPLGAVFCFVFLLRLSRTPVNDAFGIALEKVKDTEEGAGGGGGEEKTGRPKKGLVWRIPSGSPSVRGCVPAINHVCACVCVRA